MLIYPHGRTVEPLPFPLAARMILNALVRVTAEDRAALLQMIEHFNGLCHSAPARREPAPPPLELAQPPLPPAFREDGAQDQSA